MRNLPELTFDWSAASGELPEDNMGRAEHARNLTQFLIQKGQETSYVLNLNAKWGTGKTYFLRRWLTEIENVYPAVYIDAWSSGHSSDPLLSVVSEVQKKLHELHNISGLETALFEGVAKAVKAAAPAIVKAVLKGQLKKLTGVNVEDFREVISDDDLADAGGKLVKEAISVHNEATAGVKQIKLSVRDWLASVVQSGGRHYPLFIFIDELDRCRPTYAIEMLETIKHIFDMENVVFVVATDKDQLQHSIRAIYGAGFDSRLYLDRFFTRTVTLSNPSRAEFIARKLRSSETFTDYMQDEGNFAYLPSEEGREKDMIFLLAGIADGFSWPLRTVNLWLDRLEAALIMIRPMKLEIILLSFLMALETDDADWLRKYTDNVYIFSSANGDNKDKLKFKSFNITTRWRFSMFSEQLNTSNMPFGIPSINKTYDSSIGLIAFITERLATLKKGQSDPMNSIQQEFELLHRGRELSAQHYDHPTSSGPYPHVAFSIHTYFNVRNHATLDHYIQICRYSSLMS